MITTYFTVSSPSLRSVRTHLNRTTPVAGHGSQVMEEVGRAEADGLDEGEYFCLPYSVIFANPSVLAIWPSDVQPMNDGDPYDVDDDSVILDNVSKPHDHQF